MLQIADPLERAAVSAADAGLRLAALARPRRRRPTAEDVRRILVLRLERIGDLLMSLPALRAVRERAPRATIELVVGSWNLDLASRVGGVDAVDVMDAPWLARATAHAGWAALVHQARSWRARHYDLAINLEGDIRSNLLMSLAGARWQVGFGMAGGGPFLDEDVDFDPRSHTAVNGVRLVAAAFGEPRPSAGWPVEGREAAARLPRAVLTIPPSAQAEAERLLRAAEALPPERPLIGLHVGAGRAIKEWPPSRVAEVGAWAVSAREAVVVLTGSAVDRPAADEVRRALPPAATIVDIVGGADLLTLAAVLARLSLCVTPDTGPMHIAAAVGTPVVAVFGPSSPERWGPLSFDCRIVRVDLPCSPCNRIRTPPSRCRGHTPDCLDDIGALQVIDAADSLLRARHGEVGRDPR